MTEDVQHAPTCPGFSLVELLITLACAGVLFAWGWPQYQSYAQRSQRAQARALLLQAAHWMERSASANGNYPLAPDIASHLTFPPDLPYQLQVKSTDSTFLLTAVPKGSQREDPCGALTLTHLGVRSTLNMNNTTFALNCWQR